MSTAYLIEPLLLPAGVDYASAGDFLEIGKLRDALALETGAALTGPARPWPGSNSGGTMPTGG